MPVEQAGEVFVSERTFSFAMMVSSRRTVRRSPTIDKLNMRIKRRDATIAVLEQDREATTPGFQSLESTPSMTPIVAPLPLLLNTSSTGRRRRYRRDRAIISPYSISTRRSRRARQSPVQGYRLSQHVAQHLRLGVCEVL